MVTSGIHSDTTLTFHSRSGGVQVDPNDVQLFFSEAITTQYFNVALATALVYHSMITMNQEIKYFWPKPCNPVSLIYFANRYVGVLGAICNVVVYLFTMNLASCNFSAWTGTICNFISFVLIDYILVIRVLALYQRNRKLAVCLKSLLGLEVALGLGILIYGNILQGVVVGVLAEGVTVCGQINPPPKTLDIISWIIPLTFGLILFALALYKAAEYWKLSAGFKGFNLVNVLIQDQALYYGFVIFCSILRMLGASIFIVSPLASTILGAAGSPTLLCILGGQLLINLKEAGEMGVNGGTNYRSQSVSDIDFAQGPGDAPNEQSSEGSVA